MRSPAKYAGPWLASVSPESSKVKARSEGVPPLSLLVSHAKLTRRGRLGERHVTDNRHAGAAGPRYFQNCHHLLLGSGGSPDGGSGSAAGHSTLWYSSSTFFT